MRFICIFFFLPSELLLNCSISFLGQVESLTVWNTFVWQLLKLMYQAPATASYHRSAWSNIGQTINPLIRRYAPFLNTPIATIQKWWLRWIIERKPVKGWWLQQPLLPFRPDHICWKCGLQNFVLSTNSSRSKSYWSLPTNNHLRAHWNELTRRIFTTLSSVVIYPSFFINLVLANGLLLMI